MRTPFRLIPPAAAAVVLIATAAEAHVGHGAGGGFVGGFAHPLLGWDHAAAMLAVGIWSAMLGGAAVWALPILFPLAMAVGAVFGVQGLPFPAVETGVAASAVILGLLAAFTVKAPLKAGAVLVAGFALLHGHAHGAESPAAVSPFVYGLGFIAGTALLHLAGAGVGLGARSKAGAVLARAAGLVVSAVGGAFLLGVA